MTPTSSEEIGERMLALLDHVLGGAAKPVALHGPDFDEDDGVAVSSTVLSGWVSTAGEEVERFEQDLSALYDGASIVLTASGTAALHLSFASLELTPGTGVVMPSLTFVATANAAHYAGLTPHFVDVDPVHGLLDPERVETYIEKQPPGAIGCICIVDLLGRAPAIAPFADIAARFGISLIEDSTEALGTKVGGEPAGLRVTASALSFNGNKIITTGGGGALVSRSNRVVHLARSLANIGKSGASPLLTHNRIGFNYGMPALNAALGRSQLHRLEAILEKKRSVAEAYLTAAASLDLRPLEVPPDCAPNHWLTPMILPWPEHLSASDRLNNLSRLIKRCEEAGYTVRPFWMPLHKTKAWAAAPRGTLEHSERLSECVLTLPSSAVLADTLPSAARSTSLP